MLAVWWTENDRCEQLDNGHLVYSCDDGLHWYYADNDELAICCSDNLQEQIWNPRPCPKCNELPTMEGCDACLGYIPGVYAACCGHGIEEGNIVYEDGLRVQLPKIK